MGSKDGGGRWPLSPAALAGRSICRLFTGSGFWETGSAMPVQPANPTELARPARSTTETTPTSTMAIPYFTLRAAPAAAATRHYHYSILVTSRRIPLYLPYKCMPQRARRAWPRARRRAYLLLQRAQLRRVGRRHAAARRRRRRSFTGRLCTICLFGSVPAVKN